MVDCSGAAAVSQPQQTYIGAPVDADTQPGQTLTPAGGFIAIFDLDVIIPGGSPSWGMVATAEANTTSGAAGADGVLQMRVTDLFNSVETVLAFRQIEAEPSGSQSLSVQVPANNLAPGTHRFRLLLRQSTAGGPTLTVAGASLRVDVMRANQIAVSEPE